MAKSADAFRTISEVADWLGTPAHVLRFWESKFSQIKPVKRAGGRRYYRPADMELIGGIKKLLHDDGMTIKGVQKVLRDQGVKYVAGLSQPVDGEAAEPAGDVIEGRATPTPEAAPESATVLRFQREAGEAAQPAAAAAEAAPEDEPESPAPATGDQPGEPAADSSVFEDFAAPPEAPEPPREQPAEPRAEEPVEPAQAEPAPAPEPETAAPPEAPEPAEPAAEAPTPAQSPAEAPAALPAFLHRARPEAAESPEPEPEPEAAQPEPEPEPAPEPLRPARIDLPSDPADDSIDAPPGLLAAIAARKGRPLRPAAREEAGALVERLAAVQVRRENAAAAPRSD